MSIEPGLKSPVSIFRLTIAGQLIEQSVSIYSPTLGANPRNAKTKKADVAEHPEVFHQVGLLANGPSGRSWFALQLVIRQIKPLYASKK
jgi:hypothetical protein